LRSKSDETTARKGEWTTDEDSTLKDAVEKHDGEDWAPVCSVRIEESNVLTQVAFLW
jgi:hypothetical protein